LTHLASHTHRGQTAFNTIGILNQFKGTLVRDGWLSYNWYGQCRHSLCNAHLLRDLTYIGEAEPPHKWWTTALAKLLIEIKEAVKAARNSLQPELDSDRGKDFLNRYDALLAQAEEAVRGSPEQKSTGLTAGKLLNRFIKNKAEVLRFMTDLKVPFDNNGSERDLRMLKLQQKIAGCFRTTEGVTAFCRVRSYLSSARKQGRSLLIAIESALKGKPIALIS
jgi:transposase